MQSHQLISVIIPVYNGDRYLGEAIQSVLDQTYPVHEVIVVDDGSTDKSAEIARQFPQVKLLTQPNQGDATARNLGVKYATGDFIAFLDADDRWLPHKLAQQMQVFSVDASIDIIFTHVQQFISPELDPSIQANLHCPTEPMAGQLPTTTMMRRSSFQKIGNFNSQLKLGTFIDWIARAQEANLGIITLPETLAERRIHTTNMGIQLRNSRQDYIQIVKAALDRRRH
jgi:glycosyltransferase involved in cell wall biosynthesis